MDTSRGSRAAATAILAAAAALALAAGGGSARAMEPVPWSPQQIVAATNDERARHGIPPVTLRADWSSRCAKHVRWMLENGVLAHEERPGTPAYTPEGNWAGTRAILATGTTWANGNPWAAAPLHLNQLLAPQLRAIGAWEAGGATCVTTAPGLQLTSRVEPRFYVWPGDGHTDAAPAVRAAESPFVPGQFTGLPEGTVTGPNLMVYAVGWDRARILSATLRPAGRPAVAVLTIDRADPTVGPYLVPGSGFVIPVRPLLPLTRYRVEVRVRNLATGAVRSTDWRFRTTSGGDDAPQPDARRPVAGVPEDPRP